MKLDRYSINKLEQLKAEIEAEIAKRKKKMPQMQKELEAMAKKYGVSVEELKNLKSGGGRGRAAKKTTKGKRGKVAPKYRNPDNPSETWTGRGRAPVWVAGAEQKYGSRDALLIENQQNNQNQEHHDNHHENHEQHHEHHDQGHNQW